MVDVSPPSASSIHTAYSGQEGIYATAAKDCELLVRRALVEANVDFSQLESRHKRPLELYKKQKRRRYANPWFDCPDLVGVRVILPLASSKADVATALSGSGLFDQVEVEDQSQTDAPELLTYRGLHLHVWPSGMLNAESVPIRCEVQVRTIAEHSWAVTEHKYVYKKNESLPFEVERVFRRLLVLVELFDEELSRGVDMIRADPSFAEMRLVLHLEELFEDLSGLVGDQEITKELVNLIRGTLGMEAVELGALVDEYLLASSESVTAFLAQHGPNTAGFDPESGWLTSQPELLLVLALLDKDEHQLSSALAGSDAFAQVESIALWTDHPGFAI